MREVSAGQLAALSQDTTRPIYLVDLLFSGEPEFLSTNGNRLVGNEQYVGGDIAVAGVGDWTQASIRLTPTPARVSALLNDAWRGTACRVWLLPVSKLFQFWAEDYAVEDYGHQGATQHEPILLLDGVLTAGRLSDSLELEVAHRALLRRWTPRLRAAPPVCNHMPAPGSRVEWQGEVFTLESRL